MSKKHNHKQHKFTDDIEKQIVDIASANPRILLVWGFPHDGHYVYGWLSYVRPKTGGKNKPSF